MSSRPERLPDLSSTYSLTPDQIAAYQRDGHICLRAAASAEEVVPWRQVIEKAVEDLNTESRSLEERDTYAKAFLQITNLWQRDDAVKPFVLSRRFGRIAAELMGVGGVRLYHDQALFKEAHGGHTPWHQDQYYWPLDGVPTVTMWMALVDVSVEMGAITFASGSQRKGFLGHIPISDASDEHFDRFVRDEGYPVVNASMRAGDATFHSGWVLHSAPPNASGLTREAMTIIYFADGGRVSHPDNPNRQRDLQSWLPGLQPGDAAASPLNPLIWSRG